MSLRGPGVIRERADGEQERGGGLGRQSHLVLIRKVGGGHAGVHCLFSCLFHILKVRGRKE